MGPGWATICGPKANLENWPSETCCQTPVLAHGKAVVRVCISQGIPIHSDDSTWLRPPFNCAQGHITKHSHSAVQQVSLSQKWCRMTVVHNNPEVWIGRCFRQQQQKDFNRWHDTCALLELPSTNGMLIMDRKQKKQCRLEHRSAVHISWTQTNTVSNTWLDPLRSFRRNCSWQKFFQMEAKVNHFQCVEGVHIPM